MNAPTPTRCPYCGTRAAEILCHVCKQPRPAANAPSYRAAAGDPPSAAELERANHYADVMSRRDRFSIVRPEHDTDTAGRPLTPGS